MRTSAPKSRLIEAMPRNCSAVTSPSRDQASAETVPLAMPRTTLDSAQRCWGVVPGEEHRLALAHGGDRIAAAARRRVAALGHLGGDATGPGGAGHQELARREHASLHLLEAELVDDPLHAGAQLVVAVAGLLEDPDAGLDRRQQLVARGELLECQGGVRIGAQASGDEHPEAGLDRAVGRRCG